MKNNFTEALRSFANFWLAGCEREPATQPGGLGASRETPDHWTADAVRYLPKCLYYQANPQRARLAMTGFLPCSILAEKAKLLKTKEL
jgi:hypothetical protein